MTGVAANRSRSPLLFAVAATLAFGGVGLARVQASPPLPSRHVMLAFTRGDDHEQLWVAAEDGSGQTRISTRSEKVTTPAGFSPRAGLVAWWSIVGERNGEAIYDLRVWPVTGGTPRTIYEDAQATYWIGDAPEFAPDGKFIIFGRANDEYGPNHGLRDWGLWQIGVDGTHPRQLTKGLGTGTGSRRPRVSPDGKMIAFYGNDSEESGRLCLVARSGGKVRQTRVWIDDFVWWPRSHAVLVTEPEDEDTNRLASYDLRTGRLTRLTGFWGGRTFLGPTFSPEGGRLAYGVGALEGSWVRVLEARPGPATRRLANTPASVALLNPIAWSPTGDRLIVCDGAAIWSMRPDGRDRRKLVDDAALTTVFWK
jgi:Tol biopolymer transport system component